MQKKKKQKNTHTYIHIHPQTRKKKNTQTHNDGNNRIEFSKNQLTDKSCEIMCGLLQQWPENRIRLIGLRENQITTEGLFFFKTKKAKKKKNFVRN